MTREEFEALLKMEGKHLEIKPLAPAQRSQKYKNKCYTLWKATVWEPMRMSHLVISPHFAQALGVDLNDLLDDYMQEFEIIASTNRKALKHAIIHYLERVQYRANHRG